MRNTSGLHPKGDMLLVELAVVQDKSTGGIAIPDEILSREQNAQTYGRVIERGNSLIEHPSQFPRMYGVKDGDMVLFARYAGYQERGKDDVLYRLIRADDVICTKEFESKERPIARMALNKAFDIVGTAE